MTREEAKVALSFHSGRNADIKNPRWEAGFVPSLRPFREEGQEASFHEIMEAILALAPSLQGDSVEEPLMADLWGIVHLAKYWGYSNRDVLTDAEAERVEFYADHISVTVFCLLDGCDVETAFELYWSDYPERNKKK